MLYLEHAMPMYCKRFDQVQQHGRLVFTPTGLPHKGSLSYHFKRMLHKLGMPRAMDIAPQVLRHIFTDERSCANPVAGPSDRDASLVMGNSEKAWAASYQLSRWHGRAAQRAADEMQSWGAALLQQPELMPVLQLEQLQQFDDTACTFEEDDIIVIVSEEDEEGMYTLLTDRPLMWSGLLQGQTCMSMFGLLNFPSWP